MCPLQTVFTQCGERGAGVGFSLTPRCDQTLIPALHLRFTGAPVDVGMSIDIASIDMVSEVNMVSTF